VIGAAGFPCNGEPDRIKLCGDKLIAIFSDCLATCLPCSGRTGEKPFWIVPLSTLSCALSSAVSAAFTI